MNKGCQDIVDVGQYLIDKARSVDIGVMLRIVSKTPLGIEWLSSSNGVWFMQNPSMQSLVLGWDGKSDVEWFWDAIFQDGREVRASVTVPSKLMKEIQNYYFSIEL